MGTRLALVAAQQQARPLRTVGRSRAVVRVRPLAAVWARAAPQLATAVPRRVVEALPSGARLVRAAARARAARRAPGAARVVAARPPEARQVQAPRLPAQEV